MDCQTDPGLRQPTTSAGARSAVCEVVMSFLAPIAGAVVGGLIPEPERAGDHINTVKEAIRGSFATGALLDGYYKPLKPANRACEGCGAPTKHMQHSCEYCGRES